MNLKTSTLTALEDGLLEHLERRAEATCRKIVALCSNSGPVAAELQDKFHAAVADIERVSIEALERTEGAFVVEDGVLRIAAAPVSRLLQVVLDDLRSRSGLASEEFPEFLERVFMDYVLHELRHRTQGVGEYSTIQQLKSLAGRVTVAEVDLFADRDAAFAYAAIFASGPGRAEFLESFREALFLSSAYFYKVFPVSAARPDKIARAIGVLLMAARLAGMDPLADVKENPKLPLDTPLYVKLATSHKELAIFQGEPSVRLLGVANDTDGVGALVSDVKQGRFDAALTRAIRIAKKLNLLR